MRFIIVLLLGIHAAYGAIHSLRYIYTATTGIPHFPEFVDVGMVDDQVISYYDSIIKKKVARQDWMKENFDHDYWDSCTENLKAAEYFFKMNLQLAQQRFNQTEGVHTYQLMYGCEWDEETGDIEGYKQFGYDGDDFLFFDLKSMTWIAPVQQAVITKQKWEGEPISVNYEKNYLTQECFDWLKKYLDFGKRVLQRTVYPSVSLLQKNPSSPVTCHATGLYPRGVMVFWRRDGEEVYEDVYYGEILPNQDGTFQKSVDLTVTLEDLDSGRCECVVQLSGVKEDFVTKLERSVVKTNRVPDDYSSLIIGLVVPLLLVICISGCVVFVWRRWRIYGNRVLAEANDSDGDTADVEPTPRQQPAGPAVTPRGGTHCCYSST